MMNQRKAAAQATLDAFKDKALVWGKTDCGRLAGALLREMGRSPRLTRFGPYKTPAGALKAMKKAGFDDLPDVLDDMGFRRIPLAMVLVGDLIGLPGDGMTALSVAMGNRKILGFAEDGVCRVGKLVAIDRATAWRVTCLK